MKRLLLLLLIIGCTQAEINRYEDCVAAGYEVLYPDCIGCVPYCTTPSGEIFYPKNDSMPMRLISNYSDVIAECDSLCGVDAVTYCTVERTITIDGEEVTGTCRAFSKTDNGIEGFNRCTGFCKSFDKSGTVIN